MSTHNKRKQRQTDLLPKTPPGVFGCIKGRKHSVLRFGGQERVCARVTVCERKACCSVICWLHPWGSRIATPDYLQASASASEVILQREIETFFSHFYPLSSSHFLSLLTGPLYLFALISKPPFVSGVFSPLCFQRRVGGLCGFDDHPSEDFFHHLNIPKVFGVLL